MSKKIHIRKPPIVRPGYEVKRAIEDVTGIRIESIRDQAWLKKKLKISTVTLLDILELLEERLGIQFAEGEEMSIAKVSDIVALTTNKVNDKNAQAT